MTSHNPEPPVPLATALPGAVQRLPLLERLSRYRQPIGLMVTLLLFTMALIACRHLLSELDIYALHDAMLSVPTQSLLGALLATVIGFVILLGYEWSASRYAGVKLPARSLALGGFSAFAIGNAIGLSMLSGGSVRYRLYARQGLGAGGGGQIFNIGKSKAQLFEKGKGTNITFKDVAGHFLKRPEAKVHFTSHDGAVIDAMIDESLATGERINKPVSVLVTCPSLHGDEPMATFTLTLSVKAKKKK